MPVCKASTKRVRITARKARLVIDLIRGKKVDEASAILKYTNKSASFIINKVLNSAISNAENNLGMKRENLYIEKIFVDEGPTLKRFQPRAKGSAYEILKRTSHITIILSDKKGDKNGTKS